MSRMPPIGFQKNHCREMRCSRADHSRKRAVAARGAGREALQLRGHQLAIREEIEAGAIGEERAPLRIEPHEIERALAAAAGLGEEAIEHRRQRENGRPHIEAEAVLLEHGRLAAEPLIALEKDGAIAARGERAGGREAARAAADHAHGTIFRGGHKHFPRARPRRRNSATARTRSRQAPPCSARRAARKSAASPGCAGSR